MYEHKITLGEIVSILLVIMLGVIVPICRKIWQKNNPFKTNIAEEFIFPDHPQSKGIFKKSLKTEVLTGPFFNKKVTLKISPRIKDVTTEITRIVLLEKQCGEFVISSNQKIWIKNIESAKVNRPLRGGTSDEDGGYIVGFYPSVKIEKDEDFYLHITIAGVGNISKWKGYIGFAPRVEKNPNRFSLNKISITGRRFTKSLSSRGVL